MKKLVVLALAAALVLGLALAAAAAEEKRDLKPEEWIQFKSQYLGQGAQDGAAPWKKGDRYPGCYVCYSNPSCRSGYKQTGYTDMVNHVVEDYWGKDTPGPGGYVRLFSKTIVENGVAVHDHVKAAVCDPQ